MRNTTVALWIIAGMLVLNFFHGCPRHESTTTEVKAKPAKVKPAEVRHMETEIPELDKFVEGLKKATATVSEMKRTVGELATAKAPALPVARPAVFHSAPPPVETPVTLTAEEFADQQARRADRIRYLRNEVLDDSGRLARWKNAQHSVIDPDIRDIRRAEIRAFEQKLNDKRRELAELLK